MAPGCVCGHKASEHKKQMNMRTRCEASPQRVGPQETWPCACQMYRSVEANGNTPTMVIFDEAVGWEDK